VRASRSPPVRVDFGGAGPLAEPFEQAARDRAAFRPSLVEVEPEWFEDAGKAGA
jgi:hypothetical protein